VAKDWWELVDAGTYARRRGRAKQLSASTIADYRLVLFGPPPKRKRKGHDSLVLMKRCGNRRPRSLDDSFWQSFVDELARSGKSYSRISTYLAVIRHIYAYAKRANRRLVPLDPTREVVMPANDGKPRERVATRGEAAKLVEAIPAAEIASSLNWAAILEIRRSSASAVALARRFGVSDSLIHKVRRKELYKTDP